MDACDRQQGGELIMQAWKFTGLASRSCLRDPLECEARLYKAGSHTIQKRLIGDFSKALRLLDRCCRDCPLPAANAGIMPFRETAYRRLAKPA